jgi:hypothetical protein
MAIGDGHSGEGATSHHWDADVARVVHQLLNRFPALTANTYDCHPFCGPPGNRQAWARRSVDVWGAGGRGDNIGPLKAVHVRDWLMELNGLPLIRHLIHERRIWVRGSGWLPWRAADHDGELRHIHVTYLPVPPL